MAGAKVAAREANFSSETVAFIQSELDFVRSAMSSLSNATLGASLASMVRFNMSFSSVKTLTLCLHLPDQYPAEALITEIRSKTLGHKLTDGLTQIADAEAKKYTDSRQIMAVASFVHNWIRDNPLCAAADEISKIKNNFMSKENKDKIKLIQEESKAVLTLCKSGFELVAQVTIPNDYPISKSDVKLLDSNLPLLLRRHAEGHCQEIARRCVQKPIYRGQDKKMIERAAKWEPSPVFTPLAEFLFPFFRECTSQLCPVCGKLAIEGVTETAGLERVYCTHLYHHACLDKYMKTPPFSEGKPCLHNKCGKLIFHDKWRTSAEVMESRWAAQQAKQRELAEVADFLN